MAKTHEGMAKCPTCTRQLKMTLTVKTPAKTSFVRYRDHQPAGRKPGEKGPSCKGGVIYPEHPNFPTWAKRVLGI